MIRMRETERDYLTDVERKRIYWLSLAQQLPKDGVRTAFATEEACLQRLKEVRWPDGVTCIDCDSQNAAFLSARLLFQCRTCRRQFSITSGTIMHRSHLSATIWFAGAERLIKARSFPSRFGDVMNHDMADFLGVHCEAGWRMKKKLSVDLSPGGVGLIRGAVCVKRLRLPDDLELGTIAHLRWLDAQRLRSERNSES